MHKIIFLFLITTALPIAAMEEAAQASTQHAPQKPYAVIKVYQSKDWIPKHRNELKDLNSLREQLNELHTGYAPEEFGKMKGDTTTLAASIEEWVQNTREEESSSLILKNKWTNYYEPKPFQRVRQIVKTQVVLIKHPRVTFSRTQSLLPLDAQKQPFALYAEGLRGKLAWELLQASYLQSTCRDTNPKKTFESLYSAEISIFVAKNIEQ